MGHNLYGDIPEDHRKLAKELLELEEWFDNHPEVEPADRAKGMTCCAHDWYSMGDDDKGSELLIKANEICPGYFDNEMQVDVLKDPDFAVLVQSLHNLIFSIAKSVLEQKKC
jgi:hypothetical protein